MVKLMSLDTKKQWGKDYWKIKDLVKVREHPWTQAPHYEVVIWGRWQVPLSPEPLTQLLIHASPFIHYINTYSIFGVVLVLVVTCTS